MKCLISLKLFTKISNNNIIKEQLSSLSFKISFEKFLWQLKKSSDKHVDNILDKYDYYVHKIGLHDVFNVQCLFLIFFFIFILHTFSKSFFRTIKCLFFEINN